MRLLAFVLLVEVAVLLAGTRVDDTNSDIRYASLGMNQALELATNEPMQGDDYGVLSSTVDDTNVIHPGPALPVHGIDFDCFGDSCYTTEELTAEDPLAPGLYVLDDHLLQLDPEFAATFRSVMKRENCCRPWLDVPIEIGGVTYLQRGCMQLLLDSAMLHLIADLGFTPEQMYECWANVTVANAWYLRTNNGIPWRLWAVKPKPEEREEPWHD